MKLAVLVPSADYLNNAGVRIRYGRIATPLQSLGWDLELIEIGEFKPEFADHDVVIISKCHDARAILIAATLRQRGRRVGVDLFDDYFSQGADSRMVRFRRWLQQLTPWLSFALCSTPAMAAIAKAYRSDLSVVQLNDPAPANWDFDLADRLDRKLAEARDERILRFCWFGIGDNPHFPVGLSDIAVFADQLAEIGRLTGASLQLRILTNARALGADGLALIRSLPVQALVEEWSEAGEAALLAQSFACFLPVNAQSFSAAKSLNRAVTALTSGCQVLSAGFPLYAPFHDLIYRDVQVFADDFNAGSMKLAAGALPSLQKAIGETASALNEAGNLVIFLQSVEAGYELQEQSFALIHGVATSGAAHKMVQALGGLSVAVPHAATKLGYDVVFKGSSDLSLEMYVAPGQAGRLTEQARKRLWPVTEIDGRRFALLPPGEGIAVNSSGDWAKASLPFQLASYNSAMVQMHDRLREAFGPMEIMVSENSRLPFGANSVQRAK